MEFLVKKEDRLDRFLRTLEISPWLSKRAWEEVLANGWVRVDGKIAKKPGIEVSVGMRIQLSLPPLGLSGSDRVGEFLEKRGELYFFQKPLGVSTYPLLPFEQNTFAHQIAAYFQNEGILTVEEFEKLGDPPILEGGLLQRLDRDTTGIVACAIDRDVKAKYRDLFSGKIKKRYHALLSSVPREGEVFFTFPSLEGKTVKALISEPSAMAVKLQIKVLEIQAGLAWVEIETNRGHRHIIRATMAALSAPLVGDAAYGGLGRFTHHLLHAFSLEIPGLGVVSAPIARTFLDCAKQLGFNREG